MQDAKESIIEAIRTAFAGVKRGRITLHEAEEIDSYSMPDQCAEARKLDRDTDWTQIPDSAIVECRHALLYLDPASWRYYIPYHMIWVLNNPDNRWEDHTVLSLRCYANNVPRECFLILDLAQCQAICRFLKFREEEDGHAEEALDSYWRHFDDGA